ncbi:sigma-70 family RNA polymerase sigma factor [Micromonospora zingiberis]|uniref:RNA polymerase sigma factor n=1 Tax=Micromonospora zingiberis TaxID=2053011 RepID=A0A4V6N3A3_9ACTN|nr:RNA polymerase subunit sigma-70 [Micromonospora zingiberis]TCB96765.1 sigma-70 family RNA polymerase sigma factor [Micromonospora zingiberis]
MSRVRVNSTQFEVRPSASFNEAPSASLDEVTFGRLVETHRRELQVHCYRMLGSFQDAEDLVQETFLRAWRKRDTFAARSTVRAWLYRIATNACLDFLSRHPRQPRAGRGPVPAETGPRPTTSDEVYWLQPYPDRLLEPAAPADAQPDAALVAKETIELAFLVAIQHLPPRQRAVLILRDVLGWPAAEAADLLELSVASANSALQRARANIKDHLPPSRIEWAPTGDPTDAERALLQRYMGVLEQGDTGAMAQLLREDIRITMPMPVPCVPGMPDPAWWDRSSFLASLRDVLDPGSSAYLGQWRSLPTRANRQPAAAHYVRRPGEATFRPQVLEVLRVADGKIVEITAFEPALFPAFGLPATL